MDKTLTVLPIAGTVDWQKKIGWEWTNPVSFNGFLNNDPQTGVVQLEDTNGQTYYIIPENKMLDVLNNADQYLGVLGGTVNHSRTT